MNILPPLQPTMRTRIDGDAVYTIAAALWILADGAAIPAFVMATGEWMFVDAAILGDAEWTPAGTFALGGGFVAGHDASGRAVIEYPRIGVHLPPEVAREMLEWCEAWLAENPDRPAIPATTEGYQRNTYRTTKQVLLTRTQWMDVYERCKREYDWGGRTGIQGSAHDKSQEPRKEREGRFPNVGRGSGAAAVAVARRPREDSLFDENRG